MRDAELVEVREQPQGVAARRAQHLAELTDAELPFASREVKQLLLRFLNPVPGQKEIILERHELAESGHRLQQSQHFLRRNPQGSRQLGTGRWAEASFCQFAEDPFAEFLLLFSQRDRVGGEPDYRTFLHDSTGLLDPGEHSVENQVVQVPPQLFLQGGTVHPFLRRLFAVVGPQGLQQRIFETFENRGVQVETLIAPGQLRDRTVGNQALDHRREGGR